MSKPLTKDDNLIKKYMYAKNYEMKNTKNYIFK